MWEEENNKLKASYKFADFNQAFAFMTSVAIAAEKANHHPWWSNVYNTVNFELCTHDADNTVTQKDRDLAIAIDKIYQTYK
jgi:4a-hydroxytetrahydrobiopterin dehydratase